MNGQLEEHLQNIDDFIQIDDKIVTYKWISKVLKIHTNTAKQLLFAFTKKPGVSDKLLVTYIVAGQQQDEAGLSFLLVHEKDLEDTKKKFHKVTSTHVYSIQKSSAVTGADIYNADTSYKLTSEDHKFCSIQPEEEIERRELKVVIPAKNQVTISASSKKTPTTKKTEEKPQAPKKASPKKNDKETEEKPQAPKKASPKKNDKQKTAPAKGGNIGALFMKQAAKKKDDSAAKVDVKETVNDIKQKSVPEKPSEKEVRTPTVNKSGAKKKRKKPNDSKDSAAKRRKRIQVASDSESSDEESDGNERFPSPEPEPITPMVIESEGEEEIIQATPVEKGKKRVRKLVDRTFEDEEGYIITKKEYVFQSVSDDETDNTAAAKKPEAETAAQEIKPNRKSSDDKSKTKEESPPSKPQKKPEPSTKVGNKPGRPASKAKTTGTNSSTTQASIRDFFTKK